VTSTAEAILRGRARALTACLRAIDVRADAVAGDLVVTGVGASEWPARVVAALRPRARFVPLSAFVHEAPRADALAVFSQALSPNARLALDRAGTYARAVLFTSARDAAFGGTTVRLPEHGLDAIAEEKGTLVRVLGPCVATLAAIAWSGADADVEALCAAIESARVPGAGDLERRVVFVTAGGYGEICSGVATLWSEALYAPRPQMVDVLGFAHGPFQELYESSALVVALERPGEHDLFDRLGRMLVPERHELVRLRSQLTAPIASIDHFAQVLELVCRALRAKPRDLRAWPGSGRDGPLYDLGG